MKRIRTMRVGAQQGFSLIELLVVIAIIVILAAILYPVFQSVREKARQAQCRANLHQLAVAVKEYRNQWGRYPFNPYYDATAGRWMGGMSALYPDFVNDKKLLLCPDDAQISSRKQAAADTVYSSYNGLVNLTDWNYQTTNQTNPDTGAAIGGGQERTYNYYGFSQEGFDCFDPLSGIPMPYPSTVPPWLRNEGMYMRHYPRLFNRLAPDNTIIAHCVHHRRFTNSATAKMDMIVTLGGTSSVANVSQMSKFDAADPARPSKWVTQRN